MILYHGTTEKRAIQIFEDGLISNYCKRFFTEEENGDGYSTQGYVYLTNEITYAIYFANCHHFVDKSENLYIFKFNIRNDLIEADLDEMRYQDPLGVDRERYNSDLECSLKEFKSCRVPFSIEFSNVDVEYCIINHNDYLNFADLLNNAGNSYNYVISHYNQAQKQLINTLKWNKV